MIKAQKIRHRDQDRLLLLFDYNMSLVEKIKTIPGRQYSKTYKAWHVPYHNDSVVMIKNLGLSLVIEHNIAGRQRKATYKTKAITNEWMSSLGNFEEYLEVKRYSASTLQSYIQVLKLFFAWMAKHEITDVNSATLITFNHQFFIEGKYSSSYQNVWISAAKMYFQKYYQRFDILDALERPRKSDNLPNVLSEKEVKRLINSYGNLKHKTIITMYYACGLRKSELLDLRLSDLDSTRKVVRIRNSKGAKDRDVALPQALLVQIAQYYRKYEPKEYLFNGKNKLKYSASSVDKLLKNGLKKASINKHITIHNLRHSYATHLVERNINLRFIQDALGHKSSTTTEIYTRLSKDKIAQMVSPIDFWQ